MKNKIINNFNYAILVVLLCTTNFAYAADLPEAKSSIIVKLILTMGIVLLSSIAMTVCLSIYNKFIVKTDRQYFGIKNDSLKTPEDIDQAVMTYITKNKLK